MKAVLREPVLCEQFASSKTRLPTSAKATPAPPVRPGRSRQHPTGRDVGGEGGQGREQDRSAQHDHSGEVQRELAGAIAAVSVLAQAGQRDQVAAVRASEVGRLQYAGEQQYVGMAELGRARAQRPGQRQVAAQMSQPERIVGVQGDPRLMSCPFRRRVGDKAQRPWPGSG